MDSLDPEPDPKSDLNDSGYVQEETSKESKEEKPADEETKPDINLLELSDDVLLCILQYCSPRDLKALGYTCPRLGDLVLDHTLWQRVDARDEVVGNRRMQWLLSNVLDANTTAFHMIGFAREVHKGYVKYGPKAGNNSNPADQPSTSRQATSGDIEAGMPLLVRHYPDYPLYNANLPLHPDDPINHISDADFAGLAGQSDQDSDSESSYSSINENNAIMAQEIQLDEIEQVLQNAQAEYDNAPQKPTQEMELLLEKYENEFGRSSDEDSIGERPDPPIPEGQADYWMPGHESDDGEPKNDWPMRGENGAGHSENRGGEGENRGGDSENVAGEAENRSGEGENVSGEDENANSGGEGVWKKLLVPRRAENAAENENDQRPGEEPMEIVEENCEEIAQRLQIPLNYVVEDFKEKKRRAREKRFKGYNRVIGYLCSGGSGPSHSQNGQSGWNSPSDSDGEDGPSSPKNRCRDKKNEENGPSGSGQSGQSKPSVSSENGQSGPSKKGQNKPSGSSSRDEQSGPSTSDKNGLIGPNNNNKDGQSGPNSPSKKEQNGNRGPSKNGQSGPSKSSEDGPSKSGQSGKISQNGELSSPRKTGQNGPSKGGQNSPSTSGQSGSSKCGQNGENSPSTSGQSGPKKTSPNKQIPSRNGPSKISENEQSGPSTSGQSGSSPQNGSSKQDQSGSIKIDPSGSSKIDPSGPSTSGQSGTNPQNGPSPQNGSKKKDQSGSSPQNGPTKNDESGPSSSKIDPNGPSTSSQNGSSKIDPSGSSKIDPSGSSKVEPNGPTSSNGQYSPTFTQAELSEQERQLAEFDALERIKHQVLLSSRSLQILGRKCHKLVELSLEYCVFDALMTRMCSIPPTLKKLSLFGTKCLNMEKPFLFKIHDYLLQLEELDISSCDWVEPSCLLQISKMVKLHTLLMRDCPRLTEFVAYASLATRYGFKTLKHLDVRGSPLGDSEVSALGWVSSLERLFVSAAPAPRHARRPPPAARDWHAWEDRVPEYFKSKLSTSEIFQDELFHPSSVQMNPFRPLAVGHIPGFNGGGTFRILDDFGLPSANRNRPPPDFFFVAPPRDNQNNRNINNINLNNRNQDGNQNNDNNQDGNQNNDNNQDGNQNNDNNQDNNSKRKNDDDDDPSKKMKIDDEDDDEEVLDNQKYQDPDNKDKQYPEDEPHLKDGKRPKDDRSQYDDSSDDDDDGPSKPKRARLGVNVGASTSKFVNPITHESTNENANARFNQALVIQGVMLQNEDSGETPENSDITNNNSDVNANIPEAENRPNEAQVPEENPPRQKILVVNVGRRRHQMYQLEMPPWINLNPEPVDLSHNHHWPGRHMQYYRGQRLDRASLVTDSAIRRFGRAAGENINYVHIGPHGPMPVPLNDPHARPDRSNLRVLSVTGFRGITNLSLNHLATAAPFLQQLDFSGTSVTDEGVEHFRSLRPDCEVTYTKKEEKDEPPKPPPT